MRADRLVATLLFLQARGRVTATEVAEELEVSVRTARRDLEALAIAGIPVYSQPGRGGGWSLIGGARTDLTGLTAAEARTLFLIAGPSSAVTPEAKAALRKLVHALPETFRAEAEKAASAIVLDPARWGGTAPSTPPHLETLQQAVVQGVQIQLGYTDAKGALSERTVHPLGLVSKGTIWYLLADTDAGRRTFRVWRVRSVELTDEPAQRPPGFDLHRGMARGGRHASTSGAVAAGHCPRRAATWSAGCGCTSAPGSRSASAVDGRPGHGRHRLPAKRTTIPARELCAYSEGLEVLSPADVRDAPGRDRHRARQTLRGREVRRRPCPVLASRHVGLAFTADGPSSLRGAARVHRACSPRLL